MEKYIINIIATLCVNEPEQHTLLRQKTNIQEEKIMDETKNGNLMTDSNAGNNLKEAANYLIQLFYLTGQQYSCTRTKIGKLLSIVSFVYAKKNIKIFKEAIYKYGDCGTLINELKADLERDIYIKSEYKDEKARMILNLEKDVEIPEKYMDVNTLSQDVKDTINNVFQNFGSYKATDLGNDINCILNQENILDSDNRINLERICELEIQNFPENAKNEIIIYIFS